jgi:quercetin dioxygenase-like cupin family protein
MNVVDNEKYLVRKPIYGTGAGYGVPGKCTMTILSSRQVPEANYSIEIGWIDGKPKPSDSAPEHVHDFDEILLHWGSNHETPQVLGGEIEFKIGGQTIKSNTTTGIYLPKGVPHGPITWKEYKAPQVQMVMMLGTGIPHQGQPAAASGKAQIDKGKKVDYEQYVIRSPMREAGAEFVRGRTAPTMTYMSGVQIPGVKTYIEMGWTFDMPMSGRTTGGAMPEMLHKSFDEIVLHVGGDTKDPEDLGGEIEFYVGGQPLTFSTTSALFIPRGVHHGPLACKAYRKPHIVMAIMCGAGNVKDGWADSFITNKPEGK